MDKGHKWKNKVQQEEEKNKTTRACEYRHIGKLPLSTGTSKGIKQNTATTGLQERSSAG